MNTPVRQLGRVPPLTWATLRDAAARARMPFSRWAVDRLLAAALAETATPPAAGTAGTECRPCSSPPTQ
jgi:hypothetical protein